MGYRVTTALTIGHGDGHLSFMYFVPSFQMEFHWIREWFDQNFDNVASRVGPNAVIVSPFLHAQDQYRRELEQAIDWQRLGEQDSLRGNTPLLVVSRRPIRADSPVDVALVNLASAETPAALARIVDALADAISKGIDLVDGMPVILKSVAGFSQSRKVESATDVARMFELKPNIMGLGLNVNEIIEWFGKRRQRR